MICDRQPPYGQIPFPAVLDDSAQTRSTVVEFLRGVLSASFAQATSISEDEDFYAHGLDSLQTLVITSTLKRSLQDQASKPVAWITPRLIYRNPTLADLSRLLVAFLNEGITPQEDNQVSTARLFEETVAQYVEGLSMKSAASSEVAAPSKTSKVALIGSTGYLGSHIVMQLLKSPEISHIYCLNRGDDAENRQLTSLLRNLGMEAVGPETVDRLWNKLVFMTVDIGKPQLGMAKNDFDLLAREVEVIIYNSWRLDFCLSLRSFSPFLRATRDLVDLSATSSRNLRVVFVSSTSSVGGMTASMTKVPVPGVPIEDMSVAMDIGYAQSKLAAERILTIANRQSGIPVTIVRVCQICGPTDANAGGWAKQAWIDALLRTSKTLRCVPETVGPFDWVPVDTVAAMLHAFILYPARDEAQVFNIYPSKPQPWKLVVDYMHKNHGVTDTVPLREWVERLRNSTTDPSMEDVAEMPALKTLDYFVILGNGTKSVELATSHARMISRVEIPTVDEHMMERWLRDWNL